MDRVHFSKHLEELAQEVNAGWYILVKVVGAGSGHKDTCPARLPPMPLFTVSRPLKGLHMLGSSRWCWEDGNPPCCLNISPKINLTFFSPNLASRVLDFEEHAD